MRGESRWRPIVGLFLAAYVAIASGCDAVDALFTQIRPSPYPIVGQDGNTILFAISKTANPAVAAPDSHLINALHDIYALDLTTLEPTLIMGDIPHVRRAELHIVSDGTRIAWVDGVNSVVQVVDLQEGTQQSFFEGLEGAEGFSLLLLRDNRLIAFKSLDLSTLPALDTYEFIVLDLMSGDDVRVGDGRVYGMFAISDNHFALMNNQPTDVEALGLELTGNLDLVDLSTGERRTVAPNIRFAGGGLFIRDNELIWQQFRAGEMRSKIQSYDIISGRTTTLINPFDDRHSIASLADLSGDNMLVDVTRALLVLGGFRVFEVRELPGATTQIAQFEENLFDQPKFRAQPRFAGNFVVWTDTQSAEFVIYDQGSRSIRRFDPATLVAREEKGSGVDF